MMNMLDEAAVSYHVVLTKADKIKPTALAALLETTQARSGQASRIASEPCSQRRAKPAPASPSCALRSSTMTTQCIGASHGPAVYTTS